MPGATSNHAYAPKFQQRLLDLVRKKYGGPVGERFGPTLAAEHLDAEDGLVVNAETLRLWMLEAGLWSRQQEHAISDQGHPDRRECIIAQYGGGHVSTVFSAIRSPSCFYSCLRTSKL